MVTIENLRKHDILATKTYSQVLNLDEEESLKIVIDKIIGVKSDKSKTRCCGFTQKHGQPRCNLKIVCCEETLYCAKHVKSISDPSKEHPVDINIKARETEILNILIRHFKLNKKDTSKFLQKRIYYPNCSYSKEETHPAGVTLCSDHIPICWEHKNMTDTSNLVLEKKKKNLSFESMIKNSFINPYIRIYVHKDSKGKSKLLHRDGYGVSYKSIVQK